MDGIPDALPALSLMAKVRRKSLAAGQPMPDRAALVAAVAAAARGAADVPSRCPTTRRSAATRRATASIGRALEAICDLARLVGVDPEQALRERARSLIALVRAPRRAPKPRS